MLALLGLLSLGSVLGPWLLTFITYSPQNLKTKYRATWALVTGGSSGIGRSLARKLAAQGLNVVIAAMPDKMLVDAANELRKDFPNIQVRAVGVNLAAADPEVYMAPLRAATDDIPVQIVFSNAGYMVGAFFTSEELPRWLANHHCNATASVAIAHHYLRKLRALPMPEGSNGKKGCLVFTSSPANIMPTPFSAMYGATKAHVTHLATSLAAELGPDGIDVAALHPSPTATQFYASSPAMPTLTMFKNTAVGPDAVAEVAIRGVGRSIVIDQGYYPTVCRVATRILDFTLMAELVAANITNVKDYKWMKEHEAKEAAKKA